MVSSISGYSFQSARTVRNLSKALSKINSSLNRLGSGTRVMRAADDPAGLAVISRLEQSLTSNGRASNNVGDASSALAIANGAIHQIQDLSSRMQELAVQSANGLYTDQQRGALKSEYDSLNQEIQRITQTTEFNGTKLLDGASPQIQVGTDGSADSTLTIGGIDLASGIAQLSSVDISTQGGAQAAIGKIQSFAQNLNLQQSSAIGATQSRLDSIATGLSNQTVAQREALSRIADADIAAEQSAYLRNSILAQSGVSLLAQSNRLNSVMVQRLLG